MPSSTQPPPVIAADNSTPTKIVPATAGDPQSSKAVQDRLATAEREQLVSKQEEPVALSGPRRRAPGSGPGPVGTDGVCRAAGWRRRSPRRFAPSLFARTGATPSGRPAGIAPPAGGAGTLPRTATTATPRPAVTGHLRREPQLAPPRPRRRPYRLPPRARAVDSSCSFRHRRRRARRNPPSAACRQNSPTSLAAANRSFGERIWAARACSTAR